MCGVFTLPKALPIELALIGLHTVNFRATPFSAEPCAKVHRDRGGEDFSRTHPRTSEKKK